MPSTNYKQKVFRTPTNPFIGKGATKLYKLEEQRSKAIRAAAEEQGVVMGLTDYWHEMLPEALYSILESQEVGAAEIAAATWLRKRGYIVTAKEEAS